MMEATRKYEVGDRVQINPARAGGYVKVWEARILRGLFGTVTHADYSPIDGHYRIDLDVPKRVKYDYDWKWGRVSGRDLLPIQEAKANG